ncbi:MarR family winged helix-turn-helix transcriptional regulator [Paenibacillus sp. UASWS1643]|uniref:MarR family winged helix-turn-helix transcriptional regulator n=1 Tax=Paenibacillus sp. UASWS1643 TaxID=2580422 RepID=UPI00123B183A|nr:MarR family transcriptional regulator [Paenibacillus sp. UASWS1643]KAA8745371.1 MarR family transcriptional regulator [Paenibacillus sp. UASWS1643]
MDRKQMEQYIDVYSQFVQSINTSIEAIQKNIFKDSLVTPDQFNILNEINVRGICTSSMLAKETNVKKSTITATINRLVEKGVVNRIPDEQDRRIIILQLTEKGQQILIEGRARIFDALMPLRNSLTMEEFENLNTSLSSIAAQLKQLQKGLNQDEE